MSDAATFVAIGIGGALAITLELVLAIGVIWFAIWSGNHRTFGAAVLLITFLIESIMHERPSVQLGLNLNSSDFAVLLLIIALGMAWYQRPMPVSRWPIWIWVALGSIIIMNLLLGMERYGTRAGVDVRPTFYYWVAGLYFCVTNFTDADIRRIARWCLWAGYALIVIALARWIGVNAGWLPPTLIREVGASNEFRALSSDPAFVLAMLSLVHFMLWLNGPRSTWAGIHFLVFGILVVVLQHRSVWIAYFLGIVFISIQERRHLPRRFPVLLVCLFIFGVGIGLAAATGFLDRLIGTLLESATEPTDSRSTFADRYLGWQALIAEWLDSDVRTLLFGFPFGHGFRRFVNDVHIEYSPHNFYVFFLLSTGLVGTLLFLVASFAGWLGSAHAKASDALHYLITHGIGVMMFSSLVYYGAYQGMFLHGALTGLSLSMLTYRTNWMPHEAGNDPFAVERGRVTVPDS